MAKKIKKQVKKYYKKAIALGLILALTATYVTIEPAKATVLTYVKDTLSTSAPSTVANHELLFRTSVGVAASETIILTLNFDGTPIPVALDFTDIDLSYDASPDGSCAAGGGETEMTLAAAPSGATMGVVRSSATVITFTNGSTAIAASSEVCVQIGTNATEGTTGDQQITNASKEGVGVGTANIKTVAISGTLGNDDTGTALVAIVEGITVSVTVDESMSFVIAGVTNANCDTTFSALGGPDTITTSAAVPFGTIATFDTFYHACHDLNVSTNAATGFSITAEENQSLLRTAGDSNDKTIDDSSCDATGCTSAVDRPWTDASTYNGFAYTCRKSDDTGQGECSITTTDQYKRFACTGATAICDPADSLSATAVVSSSAAISGSSSRVEYKLSIDGVQPAGYYTNTVTYIATPTF